MSTSLSLLRQQRSTVLKGMDNARNQISALQDKISRLQEAVRALETSISKLETTKSSMDGLAIDESRWKGEKEDKFKNYYDLYKVSLKNFISKTEEAKQIIKEDIIRFENTIASYESGIENLQNTMLSIDKQISAALKE